MCMVFNKYIDYSLGVLTRVRNSSPEDGRAESKMIFELRFYRDVQDIIYSR
jgi:hypothetical protein